MTNEELAALKEQIKAELLREMQKSPRIRAPRPWDEIKEIILPRLKDCETYNQYQIISAISTIMRHTLGITQVANLTLEDMPKAKKIVESILDIMEKYKTEQTA